MDLHEALITREPVKKSDQADRIMSRYNCVLLCHKCHMEMQGGGGDIKTRQCAENIVSWEGYNNVLTWLKKMEQVFPTIGKQARTRFENYNLGVQHGRTNQ